MTPLPLRVTEAGYDRGDIWDAFVRAAPDSQFTHLWGWRRIVEEVLGHQYLSLVAIDAAGDWQGVLPVVRMRTPMLGPVLISMPFLNYGGPIGTSAAQDLLVTHLLEGARRTRADQVQLRSRLEVAHGLTPVSRKILVTLDLPSTEEDAWSGFPAKLRSQIRRPLKEGMEFRTGADQLKPFYTVFARNMRDLGTPVYPRRFFEAIASTFPEATFGVVYYRGIPVGAGCGFTWRNEFEITWASTVRDYNRLSPNMLLYWGFMQKMIESGVRVFNFGRSTPDTGTHRFKLQWGGRTQPLPWSEWSARPAAPDPEDSSPSRVMQVASAAWQRLPLPVANLLGPMIAPRLPWW
jgi:FemAB-related protein (PEP-CTERM system-associated)